MRSFIAEDLKVYVIVQSLSEKELIRKVTISCMPPGRGNPQELSGLSWLQRML